MSEKWIISGILGTGVAAGGLFGVLMINSLNPAPGGGDSASALAITTPDTSTPTTANLLPEDQRTVAQDQATEPGDAEATDQPLATPTTGAETDPATGGTDTTPIDTSDFVGLPKPPAPQPRADNIPDFDDSAHRELVAKPRVNPLTVQRPTRKPNPWATPQPRPTWNRWTPPPAPVAPPKQQWVPPQQQWQQPRPPVQRPPVQVMETPKPRPVPTPTPKPTGLIDLGTQWWQKITNKWKFDADDWGSVAKETTQDTTAKKAPKADPKPKKNVDVTPETPALEDRELLE